MNRRLTRLTLVFLALALLLGGANMLVDAGQKKPPRIESLVLLGRAPTDLDEVRLKNAKGSYRVYYDGENGGYVVGSLPTDLVDLDRFVGFMVSLSNLSAASKVAEQVEDKAAYGLIEPAAEIQLKMMDGDTGTLLLGAREPLSGDYYFTFSNREGLFTLNKDLAETLLSGQETFLSLQVTPPLSVSSPLSAIRDARFSGPAYQTPLEIKAVSGALEETRLKALSFGTATHLITLKGTHALDQEGGIRLLGSLLNIKALRVEKYGLSETDLAQFGLDTPDARVSFVLAGSGETVELLLQQAQEETFYAQVSGRDAVYLIEKPAFLAIQPESLVLRYLLNPMLMDIKGLGVKTPENSYDLTYQRPTGTQGEATLNGETVPIERFLAFYRLLTSAASDGSLFTGEEPVGEPALQITYRYRNEEKAEDVLRFYPLAARRMAVSINGVTELIIRDSFTSRLIQAAEDLKNGQPIEEVW